MNVATVAVGVVVVGILGIAIAAGMSWIIAFAINTLVVSFGGTFVILWWQVWLVLFILGMIKAWLTPSKS